VKELCFMPKKYKKVRNIWYYEPFYCGIEVKVITYEKTEVKTIIKYLISTKIIGIGTTAICFKMNSGNVLKLYLNTP
jgi:hypothetical protein